MPLLRRQNDTSGKLEITQQIEDARADRMRQVAAWDLCNQFLRGNQNVLWDTSTGRMLPIQRRSNKNLSVCNQLLQIHRTGCSILSTNFPRLTVLPSAPSSLKIAKAEASAMACKYLWHDNKMRNQLNDGNAWLSVAGNAALQVVFDPAKKKVAIRIRSPYDYIFEKGALTYDQSRWVAVRDIYTRQALLDAYPDQEKLINEAPFLTVGPTDAPETSLSRPTQLKDRLETWTVYYRADDKMCIYLGDKTLWEGQYPSGAFPVVPYKYTDIPNQIWGMPMLYPLIDLQIQYNKYRNMALDIADQVSNPVWLIPTTCEIPLSSITNEPGKPVVFHPTGGRPERLAASSVPPHLFEIQTRITGEMMDGAGIHASSMGKRNPGVTSGVAIESLSEADRSQMQTTMAGIEQAVAEALRVALVFWQNYLPEDKFVQMMDPAIGQVVFNEIKQTDLVEEPEVHIVPGSLFNVTANEREQRLQWLVSNRIIDGAEFRRLTTEPLDGKEAMDKFKARSHANQLLAALREGLDIEIWPFDDLPMIREVFEEFVRSDEFYAPQFQLLNMAQNGMAGAEAGLQNEIAIADKIVRVLVSVSVPVGTPPAQVDALANQKVYSPTPPPPAMGTPGPRPRDELSAPELATRDEVSNVSAGQNQAGIGTVG
jgi:hypothetical protein